jgi:hypothetical protein
MKKQTIAVNTTVDNIDGKASHVARMARSRCRANLGVSGHGGAASGAVSDLSPSYLMQRTRVSQPSQDVQAGLAGAAV